MDDDPPSSSSSPSASRLRALLPGPTREGDSSRRPPKLNIPKRISVKTACQACRQRKAKCNGQRPRCSGCITAGRECYYASNSYEAEAAAMKRKHDELKERMTDHERLYSSLKTRDPHETDEILRRIRAGKDVKGVTEDLQGANPAAPTSRKQANPLVRNNSDNTSTSATASGSASSPTFSATRMSLSQPRQQTRDRLAALNDHPGSLFEEAWREPQRRASDDYASIDLQGHILPFSRWTNIIQDDKFLSHLLLLFWTWDTSCNRILDRTIFEDDLRNLDPTTPGVPSALRFCSPFLVNALLAVSCLYTTNPITFSIPDELSTRGQIFAQEAVQCLKEEDTRPSLPVVQGLALMYVYEGALGDGETALKFQNLMQSRYMALRLDDIYRSTDTAIAGSRQRAEAHALSWIQWGFYVWDWKPMHGLCRRLAIQKPARAKTWQEENSPVNRTENPEYWWISYPVSAAPQRSMKCEIFEAECNFTEIIEQVLEFLIPLEQGVPPSRNTGRAVELYSKIMEWKFSLPEELRAENAVLPAAILLHLSADLIVISILQPFDHIPKSVFGPFIPRLTSYAHATNAMSTIWHFRALYTIHSEYWLIQACSVCAFKVLFAMEESPIQLETFIKACRALMELREAFPVAEEVIYSIESVVKNKKVNLPSYAREYMPNGAGEGVGDLKGVRVRDHSVTVEKAGPDGSEDRFTMTGLLSTLAPSETELY
ncbi:pathway-specific regulatory nit-4 [Fusarium subglutinans]|uniref:Pathway-specific regulatory nit-4 n=1 Tax=Gibberella subglutinans TaxID=42677 RepID=A0A8H5Q9E7_GIBSU|nr:pathway-specific regulatory nit-4 [Fusarium subglutinans]KAF5609878.1 pathway-specific regulatory nit-4 [Fusarium subglutinans]